jgi:hypothetical protein
MSVIARTARPTAPVPPTTATRARRWLAVGAYAGPVFLLGSFAQLPLNPGFDMTRHAFSFLSNGPYGWIQQTVFVVTGLLNVAAGIGLGQTLTGRTRLVAAVSAMLLGAGQIVAGVWAPDPAFGYPAGAPAGYPERVSLASALHGVGFSTSVLSWVVLLVTLAVWLRRTGRGRSAAVTSGIAVAVLLVPPLLGTPFGTVLLYLVMTSAFMFTAALFRRLSQIS